MSAVPLTPTSAAELACGQTRPAKVHFNGLRHHSVQPLMSSALLRSHVGPLFIPSSATYAHGIVSIVRPAQFGISGLITEAEKKAHYTCIV